MSSSEDDEGSNASVEDEVGASEDDEADVSASESKDDGWSAFERKWERIAANDPTFTQVDFNEWRFGDEGARRLVTVLPSNTAVTHLWLEYTGISGVGVTALVEVLENRATSLEILDLSINDIGDLGARALARLLRNTSSLAKLSLHNCGIGVEGARALAGALLSNSTLTHLGLDGNNIGHEGELTNSLGDEGASAFAGALPGNSTLIFLGLEGNDISDVGATALAEALPSNSTLTELCLRVNNIGDVGASLLAGALPGNSTLTELDLSENNISDTGARDLAEALPTSSLTVLELLSNSISDMGGRLLAKALLVNCTVTTLDLEENYISEELVQKMDELTKINGNAPNPLEALGLKIEWLINLDDDGAQLLGFEERGAKEKALSLALDNLDSFAEAEQRRSLFGHLLGSPVHGENVANSMEIATARTLYRYAAECGAAPGVLVNLIRAHESLCTCRDVRHKLYPFMLLATMSEAGVGDVMEVLKKDPELVRSGIF